MVSILRRCHILIANCSAKDDGSTQKALNTIADMYHDVCTYSVVGISHVRPVVILKRWSGMNPPMISCSYL